MRPNRSSTTAFVVPYERTDPSVRARVYGWLEHIATKSSSQIATTRVVTGGVSLRAHRRIAAELRSQPTTRLVLRHASPLGLGFPEVALLTRAGRGVYDLDDGLPWDPMPNERHVHRRVFKKSRIAHACAQAATTVIAGNEVLAEWASIWCDDVRLIPTCVSLEHSPRVDARARSDEFTVGWIGSPATQVHLWSITRALVAAHRRCGVKLEVVGLDPNSIPVECRPFTTHHPWSEQLAAQILPTWHLGIMPLPDTPYTRAKCAYKLLQYGAAWLPAAGSPVGASAQVLRAAGAPTPRSIDEWVDVLCAASESTTERLADLGATLRAVVEQTYSYDANERSWLDAVGLP